MAVCAFAWRRRGTSAAAFAISVCGSAVVYVLTYSIVGVGLDFRYAYWAVLAGGAMALLPDQRSERELVPGADRPN